MKKVYILLLVFIFSATILSAQTINEGFEGSTFPPTGWTKQSPDGGIGWIDTLVGATPIPGWTGGVITACPNGGSSLAFCTWSTGGATANDQWLITPQITNVPANYSLNFWMKKYFAFSDAVNIKVSTGTNAVASFTNSVAAISFTSAASDSGWVNYNYSLSAYAGQSIYIGFQEFVADNQANGAAIFLDNVKVGPSASINELSTKIYTNVYPIPAKNNITVESSNVINKVKIINMVGQVVFEKVIDTKLLKINTADFKAGVYFMQMEFTEGSITKRFIIE